MARTKKPSPDWVKGGIVADALGCSAKHLTKLRESGRLIKGVHWRDLSPADAHRPTYRYHLTAIQELFKKG
ncbi:hypothetical protein V0288_09235 [Pannus brasiliensis CCIBt3594]|uniref:Uncharacterized protein n=1 Tax=Pannus brasiliensis CCIBt3594 TaxID=1427578 RepID=A0AAW9QV92_9CHRO